MTAAPELRIIAETPHERGDLFTRLTRDLFFALGYDNLRLNVHKAGRELDLQGQHRFEPRRVLAECKAHTTRMGGTELNTFYGALTRERRRLDPTPIAGYFVSLNGFTETGIEQEFETGDDRIILLDGSSVVEELERARVVVSRTKAAEMAGRCAHYTGASAASLHGIEFLAHHTGYLWTVFYGNGNERTHFTLIHADGTALARSAAEIIIETDLFSNGNLSTLEYLSPSPPTPTQMARTDRVARQYRQWIGEECGYIQLDGLPADSELSAARLKLENLFIPLTASFLTLSDSALPVGFTAKEEPKSSGIALGQILERESRIALLASPGGGKSTLLKRLATAYAFPETRSIVSDHLPKRNFLPLYLRCRELRERAHRPIVDLLEDIPRHASMSNSDGAVFSELIHEALFRGDALLLVDGLDEISDEGTRQMFAGHLRTFVAMFPRVTLVVTSREAGFRLIGGVIASTCAVAKLDPLDESAVLELCERWHVNVVADNDKVRTEAKELGSMIWSNLRIRKLAENPLLLTTLLVVKRWIGELPRSRAALYKEAIRVLVRTWNIEGFAALDEDETLAQLSYVACAMMEDGKQRIGERTLLKLLTAARQELEAELRFARTSPQDFIRRIEYRSSLLMQTGHEVIEGTLQPVYEFRHLTFQEYLAARGIVEEQYAGRDAAVDLADVLEPRFGEERWQEVIPLAAVLAGRKADGLLKRVLSACRRFEQKEFPGPKKRLVDPLAYLLYQCILDEVQINASTLQEALLQLARNYRWRRELPSGWVRQILRGKFGTLFRDLVESTYLDGGPQFEDYNETMEWLAIYKRAEHGELVVSEPLVQSLLNDLESGDRLAKIQSAMVCVRLAYSVTHKKASSSADELLRTYAPNFLDALSRMLIEPDLPSAVASSWAIAQINEISADPPKPSLIQSLFSLWRTSKSEEQSRYFAWALATHRLLPRHTFLRNSWGNCGRFLLKAVRRGAGSGALAAIVVGWYRQAPWNDQSLAEMVQEFFGQGNWQATAWEVSNELSRGRSFKHFVKNTGKIPSKLFEQPGSNEPVEKPQQPDAGEKEPEKEKKPRKKEKRGRQLRG